MITTQHKWVLDSLRNLINLLVIDKTYLISLFDFERLVASLQILYQFFQKKTQRPLSLSHIKQQNY